MSPRRPSSPRWLLVAVVVATVAAGCGGADPLDPAGPEEGSTSGAPSQPGSEGPPQPGGAASNAAVPDDVLQGVLAAAAERAEVDVGEVEVRRAEAVTFSDGSLGCPQPGQVYTQALVDGYWVVVAAAGEELDYRVASSGQRQLCEGGGDTPRPRGDG